MRRPWSVALRRAGALLVATGAALVPGAALPAELSNNLMNASAGTETAVGDAWLAASFLTDAAPHTLTSVTLLVSTPDSGTAQVEIHVDGGLEPGPLVGTLTSPASIPSSLATATFTGSVTLDPSMTYWVVLRAVTGHVLWAWTASDTGSGTGFTHTWAIKTDTIEAVAAGGSWHSIDLYQTQMAVVVDRGCAQMPWYRDLDGDSYGNPSSTVSDCVQPNGYVADHTDCDDSDPDSFPGNPEVCDLADNDCNSVVDDAPVPAGVPALGFDDVTQLSWEAVVGATAYDVLAGDLGELAASGGFGSLQQASCVTNDLAATSFSTASISPGPGSGRWLLVRAVNCGGAGTYDADGPGEVGSRDAGITQGGYGCP